MISMLIQSTKPPEPRLESPLLEELITGKYHIVEQLYLLIQAHVAAEMSDSSNMVCHGCVCACSVNKNHQVLEKACGLTMAIAAADNVIKGMDEQIRDLEKKGEYKVNSAFVRSPRAHQLVAGSRKTQDDPCETKQSKSR